MKRPPSCGQHFITGSSAKEKFSRSMTSLTGPVFTVLGKKDPTSASLGSILTLSKNPSGGLISSRSSMRRATSSSEEISSASSIRFFEPSVLIKSGML